MSAPRVSVVTPVYNCARYLGETVDSVLAQSMEDWELILVDDGSIDQSLSVADAYAHKDSRIRVLRSERNLGVARARNRGIAESTGEYIALLDSDDLWLPDKLEKQLALAEKTGAELIYSSYCLIDQYGVSLKKAFYPPLTTDLGRMLRRNAVGCSTALVLREQMIQHPFSPRFAHEDYVLWLELLQSGCRAVGCPEVLTAYRVHRGSRSANKIHAAYGRWKVFRDYLRMPFCSSLCHFGVYAFTALTKYRRIC